MPPLAAIERFFERLFERPSARLFRTRLQPVQLQRRIERAMEAERLSSNDRTLAPNRFTVHLHPTDLEAFGDMTGSLASELADGALVFARSRRYTLVDRPRVDLLADTTVTEIMCNAYNSIWVERKGVIEPTSLSFTDDAQYRQVIDKIVSAVGRRVDESSPMVDARLPDGSRVNAIIPPLSLNGSTLTIRKFAEDPYTVADLINFGSMTMDLALFLEACVRGKLNVLVSGGTGTGKTTTLNVLSSFIPERERIVTIEDAAELQLQQPHVVRLESRPANSEGRGEVRIRDLVRNALRMRPDRIVVGEVRGGEALDMLQAMNTGHAGSITTVHANTSRDALARLETMVLMAGFDLPVRAIREQIASAINVIVQLERASDGVRRVVSVEEVQGLEGDIILLQQLFRHVPRMSVDGRQVGEIEAAGLRPKFLDQLVHSGVDLPASVFHAPVRPREMRPKTRAVPSVAELIARSGGPVTGGPR